MHNKYFFPDIITSLPQADIPIEGLTSHLLQCADHQVIFMSFERDVEIPEHSHEAQWGVVLDGEMELTINGEKEVYGKGDTYFIPKDIPHSAKIKAGYRDVTLFSQKDRYRIKK
ncbi:MAG TPA: cupin domain-containing protein [Nitrospirae bacterium]|nr:cupin domain-containing protein [Nitrospirota bacterium]